MSIDRRGAAVRRIFEHWRGFQARPELCRLTQDRSALIRNRLGRGHTEEGLIALVTYAFEADTDEARFWRGDNDRSRTYLGLDNLLRVTKLTDRVERALLYLAERDDDSEPEGDVVLDPIAAMRRAARGG